MELFSLQSLQISSVYGKHKYKGTHLVPLIHTTESKTLRARASECGNYLRQALVQATAKHGVEDRFVSRARNDCDFSRGAGFAGANQLFDDDSSDSCNTQIAGVLV